MQEIIEKEKCVGCGACYNACLNSAIKMLADNEGFLYPKINEELCINCSLCKKACPVLNEKEKNAIGKAYGGGNIDKTVKKESSSGGIYSAFCDYVIELGGVVFGATFDENFSVCHQKIEKAEDIARLRGAKYVQSQIGETYREAKWELEKGRTVLFSGTPCQIGGLKSYLQKPYENLILVDLICHGVPSPKIWEDYVKFRENKAGGKAEKISFRNKEKGWRNFVISFDFENGERYGKPISQDAYGNAFLKNLSLRPTCYDCDFKSLERQSDITLADFWGVWDCETELFDEMGTSLVLVNSSKGEMLLNSLRDRVDIKEVDINKAVSHNSAAYKSVERPKNREKLIEEINKENFEKIAKKYTKTSKIKRVLSKIKRMLKR